MAVLENKVVFSLLAFWDEIIWHGIIPEGSDWEGEEIATESWEIWNSNKNIGTDAQCLLWSSL